MAPAEQAHTWAHTTRRHTGTVNLKTVNLPRQRCALPPSTSCYSKEVPYGSWSRKLSGLSWCRLVLGERDMQSMTASAKEDVHEAAVNAYCIEFRASHVVWLFKLDAQRRAARRRARARGARARASFALLVPRAWSVSSTSYGAAHTAWELMSVGATRSSNSCRMGRRLWMGWRSWATLSRRWTAGLCKGVSIKARSSC